MQPLQTETLHKMLSLPFAEVIAHLMNCKPSSLLQMATYNLQMAANAPGQDIFVRDMLLPHLESNVVSELPVYSSGGRKQTAQVLNDLVFEFENNLGIELNSDEYASAMKYAFLFLCALCHLRNTSLAAGLGIKKTGFFKVKWECIS